MKRIIFLVLIALLAGCHREARGRANLVYRSYSPTHGGTVRYQQWRNRPKNNEASRIMATEEARLFCNGCFKILSEEDASVTSDAAYYVAPRAIVPLPRIRHAFVNMNFVCEESPAINEATHAE